MWWYQPLHFMWTLHSPVNNGTSLTEQASICLSCSLWTKQLLGACKHGQLRQLIWLIHPSNEQSAVERDEARENQSHWRTSVSCDFLSKRLLKPSPWIHSTLVADRPRRAELTDLSRRKRMQFGGGRHFTMCTWCRNGEKVKMVTLVEKTKIIDVSLKDNSGHVREQLMTDSWLNCLRP